MSRTSVSTEGHAEDQDLASNPYYISVREPCHTWGHADLGDWCCHLESWRLPMHKQLPRIISGSMALQRLGSEVGSMTSVASEGSVNTWHLVSHLGTC